MEIPQTEITGRCEICEESRVAIICWTCMQEQCEDCNETQHKDDSEGPVHERNRIDESISLLLLEIEKTDTWEISNILNKLKNYLLRERRPNQKVLVYIRSDLNKEIKEDLLKNHIDSDIQSSIYLLDQRISRKFLKEYFSTKNVTNISMVSTNPGRTANNLISESLYNKISFNKLDLRGAEIDYSNSVDPFLNIEFKELPVKFRFSDISFGPKGRVSNKEKMFEDVSDIDQGELLSDMENRNSTSPPSHIRKIN
jgi:hypothetical protein